jgi:hypothetical protein
MNQKIDATLTMSAQLLTNEIDLPNTPILLPSDIASFVQEAFQLHQQQQQLSSSTSPPSSSFQKALLSSFRNLTKCRNIFQEELFLFFVSPVSGRIAPTRDGRGYKIKIPTKLF